MIGTFDGVMPSQAVSTHWAVRFIVGGNPRPKQRPRVVRRGAYTPSSTVEAERRVIATFRQHYPGWTPVTGPVYMDLKFCRDSKRRVDLDNLSKLVQDALNGIAYADDSQIVDLTARKFYTSKERARTEIAILPATEYAEAA